MGNYQGGASLDLYLNDNQLRFDSKVGKIPHILLRMIHFENRAERLAWILNSIQITNQIIQVIKSTTSKSCLAKNLPLPPNPIIIRWNS